ncbi:MAG: anaerobic ribonucleoside-triphosphate reductase activating protein [Barnesiella sp.]|nr:anaerobic ribonucleoside-triphosphate reductase activating protein [Barnesiella sp.]
MKSLRVVDIKDGTTVDGPGFRTSIYFGGCEHHCVGCHNQSTWPPDSGELMTISELIGIVKENDFNVTFSGGDPLLQIDTLVELAVEIKRLGKSLWCYTGYTFESIVNSSRLSPILEYVDVIVDGRFEIHNRDTKLLFRGSGNQRLIDVGHWRATGETILWQQDF